MIDRLQRRQNRVRQCYYENIEIQSMCYNKIFGMNLERACLVIEDYLHKWYAVMYHLQPVEGRAGQYCGKVDKFRKKSFPTELMCI